LRVEAKSAVFFKEKVEEVRSRESETNGERVRPLGRIGARGQFLCEYPLRREME
jgi:hypothetical protein